jgi:hypothetical protein
MIKCMYLSVIIRHTLTPNLSRSKIFVLRSFRSLSINGIWAFQNPTNIWSYSPEWTKEYNACISGDWLHQNGLQTSQIKPQNKQTKTRWILSTIRLTCKYSEASLSSRRTVPSTQSKKNLEPEIPGSHNHHGNVSNLKKILSTDWSSLKIWYSFLDWT